jgi:hypothetical protein
MQFTPLLFCSGPVIIVKLSYKYWLSKIVCADTFCVWN